MLGAVIQLFQQSFCFNKPACVYAKHCCSHRQLCVAEGDDMQLVLLNMLYCRAFCDKEHTKNWLVEQIFNQLLAKIQLCSRVCTHRANSWGRSQLQEVSTASGFPLSRSACSDLEQGLTTLSPHICEYAH